MNDIYSEGACRLLVSSGHVIGQSVILQVAATLPRGGHLKFLQTCNGEAAHRGCAWTVAISKVLQLRNQKWHLTVILRIHTRNIRLCRPHSHALQGYQQSREEWWRKEEKIWKCSRDHFLRHPSSRDYTVDDLHAPVRANRWKSSDKGSTAVHRHNLRRQSQ
jgi:hypothetical protein